MGSVAPNHSLTIKSVNMFKMASSRVLSRNRSNISGIVRSRSSDVLSKEASCEITSATSCAQHVELDAPPRLPSGVVVSLCSRHLLQSPTTSHHGQHHQPSPNMSRHHLEMERLSPAPNASGRLSAMGMDRIDRSASQMSEMLNVMEVGPTGSGGLGVGPTGSGVLGVGPTGSGV